MAINYKLALESEYTNWRYLFDFAVVSLGLVFVYHLITFVSKRYKSTWNHAANSRSAVVDIHPPVSP